MPKPLKTAAILLLNIAVVLAILAIAEWSARLYIAHKHGRREPDLMMDRWAAFRTTPDLDRTGVHHNSAGFRRDSEVSVQKPANVTRIFIVGGSTAYGSPTVYPEIDDRWRITNREAIDFLLEQSLNAQIPDRRWEVINAAVPGFRVHQDVARIQSVLLRYRPDAVILIDGVNDLTALINAGANFDAYAETPLADEFNDLTNPRSFAALGTMLSTWLDRNSVLYRSVRNWELARTRTRLREQRSRANPTQLDLNAYRVAAEQIGFYRRTIRQMARVLSVDEVTAIVALQPTLRVTGKPLTATEQRLAEYDRDVVGPLEMYGYRKLYPQLARQLGEDSEEYRFVDLTDIFDHTTAQAFTDYCHLTPEANRIVVDRLFEIVKSTALRLQ